MYNTMSRAVLDQYLVYDDLRKCDTFLYLFYVNADKYFFFCCMGSKANDIVLLFLFEPN